MDSSPKMDPLDALRPLMASHSPPLHALIVPSEDAHQSEYVANHDRRRAFVSGFTGSAGLAVVTMDEALLWTDGRYFLQAAQQLSDRWKLMRIGEDAVVETWLADNLQKDAMIGVDPWCISTETAQRWEQAFNKKGQKLVQLERNLVDEIWEDRPHPTIRPVSVHPVGFAGRSSEEKLSELRTKLSQEKAYAIIITTLDEVAWLYNLRGQDVSYNPVLHSFAVVTTQSAFLYVEKKKITSEVEKYLTSIGVEIRDYGSVLADVSSLVAREDFASSKEGSLNEVSQNETKESVSHQNGQGRAHISTTEGKRLDENENDEPVALLPECGEPVCSNELNCGNNSKEESISMLANPLDNGGTTEDKSGLIWVNPGNCCYALYSKLPSDQVLLQQSPLALSKALKNPVELEGFRKSHIRDGAAVVLYLAWLDAKMQEVYGAAGYFSESKGSNKRKRLEGEKLTEVTVSDKLEEFRAKQELFMGLSFETISSVGSNAAIIHYAPNSDTCAEMEPESIYLCDSGGQYLDGTTDITRTMHFGKPSAHEKSCYTMVLKGHIALDTAIFPNGTNGHALDILARVPLWQSGLDYRHGTGHGVGSYLNVHEGPHLISFRPQARNVALQASMTVTDEPGYYEDGNFGIRLENVLIVKEAPTEHNFADKGYLTFEHITWVPFQEKMIDVSLLSKSEKAWIDDYHRNCHKYLSPLLSGSDLEWLAKATEPLSC